MLSDKNHWIVVARYRTIRTLAKRTGCFFVLPLGRTHRNARRQFLCLSSIGHSIWVPICFVSKNQWIMGMGKRAKEKCSSLVGPCFEHFLYFVRDQRQPTGLPLHSGHVGTRSGRETHQSGHPWPEERVCWSCLLPLFVLLSRDFYLKFF
jgi:hypothetical protein